MIAFTAEELHFLAGGAPMPGLGPLPLDPSDEAALRLMRGTAERSLTRPRPARRARGHRAARAARSTRTGSPPPCAARDARLGAPARIAPPSSRRLGPDRLHAGRRHRRPGPDRGLPRPARRRRRQRRAGDARRGADAGAAGAAGARSIEATRAAPGDIVALQWIDPGDGGPRVAARPRRPCPGVQNGPRRAAGETKLAGVSSPARKEAAPPDLGALDAMSEAVESGLGLPEVVRAAARALDASLVLIDRSSSVLAVAARSTADERLLMRDGEGVETHELRVGTRSSAACGCAPAAAPPSAAVLRIATTMIASEVERLRAPDRASEAAQAAFLNALLQRRVTDRGDIIARASELGADLADGRRRGRRPRASLRARRRRLARARAGRRRARGPRRRARLAGRRARRPGRPAGPRRRARSRPPRTPACAASPRASRASCTPRSTASRSRSATRASRTTRSTSTAPATRRCSPPTSRPRRPTTSRCSRSRTPAPTACCCPR